jgi:hypothetical protein
MNQISHMIDSKCDKRGTTHRIPIKHTMLLATLCGIDLHEIIFPSSSRSRGIEDPDREKMAICTVFLDLITAGPGNREQVRVCRTTSVSKYPKRERVSSSICQILALFCPLRIVRCKYMVQLRERRRELGSRALTRSPDLG